MIVRGRYEVQHDAVRRLPDNRRRRPVSRLPGRRPAAAGRMLVGDLRDEIAGAMRRGRRIAIQFKEGEVG